MQALFIDLYEDDFTADGMTANGISGDAQRVFGNCAEINEAENNRGNERPQHKPKADLLALFCLRLRCRAHLVSNGN